MNTALQDKLTCQHCRMPFWYGWESLQACRDYLLNGWTRKGKDGSEQFSWVRCAGCRARHRISELRL
jgi:hypothetical protein